jgi:hypothetical protein
MKPTTLFSFLFIFFIPLLATAQKNKVVSGEPCCGILSIGPVDGIVGLDPPDGIGPVDAITLVRDNITGRTFLFHADVTDKNNLHVGDAINADMLSNKITAINGIERGYPIKEPNWGQPCCGITSIHPNPLEPCCGIVTIQNNGIRYSFSVPKNISSALKIGQPAYMALKNSYAFFQVNTNGSMATYSYPTENNASMGTKTGSTPRRDSSGGMGSNGGMTRVTMGNNSWEIKSDPNLKGLGGEVIMQIPKEIRFNTHMKFFNAGDTKKVVASWFGNNKADLLEGTYDIVVDDKYTIKNVPVEKGKQTILHMGVLQWSSYGTVTLENGDHQKFSYAPPFKIVLPEGTYYIVGKKQPNTIVITNGNLTAL